MSASWYYVDGNERMGPVQEMEIASLIQQGKLEAESYVWRDGFDNWKHLKDADNLATLLVQGQSPPPPQVGIPSMGGPAQEGIGAIPSLQKGFDWNRLGDNDQVLTIKIGHDRGVAEQEYGPFTVMQLKQAFEENRINEKTFIYTPGMENWTLLGETPLFERLSGGIPATIEEQDRRASLRRPFVAQILCSDDSAVFEGICRDISIGGLQVLVANFPGTVGQQVQINVHPENAGHRFVASGKIVRLLEGGSGFSLRFDNLNEEAINAIQDYINQT